MLYHERMCDVITDRPECQSDEPAEEPSAAASASPRRSLLTERYSASNEAARAAEQQRIWAMTPYERIALAFALGRGRAALLALSESPKKPKP